ncbi:MAG: hypothetical protein II586_01210 [Butyrivibrio sp.]|nr:hypothetical protein [Butyrivibrio sp.]
METAVHIFAGFLDSGKTTALQGTLLRKEDVAKRSVVICTEEGEEEYDIDALKDRGTSLVTIEEEEELTEDFLEEIKKVHNPEVVYIEFNGMWDLKAFVKKDLPKGWYLANVFSLVDANTYDMYLMNMRQTIMNPLSVSDVILFNRCGESFKKSDVRRSIKILNNLAEVYFTKPDGSIDFANEEFSVPEKDGILDVTDKFFCPWFIDCIEDTDKYYGKTVRFTALITGGSGLGSNQFYAGRYAAICCAEDAQYIGFVAKYDGEIPKNGDWVILEARIAKGQRSDNKLVILLVVNKLTKIEAPEDRFLYF